MKITICGSMAFFKEMKSAQEELIKLGHEVKIPQSALEVPQEFGAKEGVYFGQFIEQNGGIDAFPPEHQIWNLKEGAIIDHFKKVSWCDAILVLNEDKRGIQGYVGGNTLMEMGVAFNLGKGIFVLNGSDSSKIPYKQEILGMKPIILNSDFSQIS